MNTLDVSDHEYAILDSIYRHTEAKPVRQRDLAQVVGISLGMTNVILKKLAQKGWVAVRKANSRNLQYAVTPSGIEEITRRSYGLLKRTVRNVVYYRQVLESYLVDVQKRGFKGIRLVGKSDFDFILEHLCYVHNLEFTKAESPVQREGTLSVYSEDFARSPFRDRDCGENGSDSLHDILIGH